jgi:predicted polyphosphate/ATP-dependent NAD kinase
MNLVPKDPAGLVVLICGGRDQTSQTARQALYAALDGLLGQHPVKLVVHGGAKGADAHGWQWAINNAVPARVHKADWKVWGNRAGPMRNQEMLDENPVDVVVALPGGDGTQDMLKRAARKKIPIISVKV